MEGVIALMEPEELKRATKEAIREWLDDQFMVFGKWSLGAFASMGIAALVYFILWANGWHK